jgi:TRAP-type mannitol/chloroaromatic compound transport system permease small subunit
MLSLAGVLVTLLMLLGVIEVISRSFLNNPIFGYIDVVGLLTSAVAFLALAYCQQSGGHIRMELLVSSLSGRTLWMAELAGALIALAVVTLLLNPTWAHALRSIQLGDSTMDIRLPLWPSKMLVPFGIAVLWLRIFLNSIGYMRLVLHPDAAPIAVPTRRRIIEDVDEEMTRSA